MTTIAYTPNEYEGHYPPYLNVKIEGEVATIRVRGKGAASTAGPIAEITVPLSVLADLTPALTIPRETLERVREALEQTISLLRATDELQANGFADDAVNQARAAIAALEGVV